MLEKISFAWWWKILLVFWWLVVIGGITALALVGKIGATENLEGSEAKNLEGRVEKIIVERQVSSSNIDDQTSDSIRQNENNASNEDEVNENLSEQNANSNNQVLLYQELSVLITKGSLAGQRVVIQNENYSLTNAVKYQVGDRVMLNYGGQDDNGQEIFYITDFVRTKALLWLFVIFVIITIVVGKWQGVSSLLGMAMSFVVIFALILPMISAGKNPVWVAVLGSALIIPATFLLSHGMGRKTWIAMLGTLVSLVITALLANFFISF